MKKRFRIALLTTWYPPVNGSFVYDQAKALAKSVDIEVFYFAFSFVPKSTSQVEDGVMVHRISFPFLPKKTKATVALWRNACAKRFLSSQKEKPFDLIHAQAYLAGFIAEEINRKTSLPYCVTLHNQNLVTKSFPHHITPFLVSMMNHSRVSICVGPKLLASVKDLSPNANFKIIPNMVDTKTYKECTNKYDGFHFATVGVMNKRKGLKLIIEAFNQLKDNHVFLDIIGPIVESGIELQDRIITHGEASREEVAAILGKCHCLVSFSASESFGISVIEGMACGLPVLYCPSGGPEYIVPDWGGIKVTRDVSALTEGMKRMLSDYEKFDKNKIRKHTIDSYDNQVIINQLLEVYKSIAKDNSVSSPL